MPPAGASAFKPRRHVHAIAIKVVTIDDQIAQMQAHAEHKRSIGRLVAVGLGHRLLELDSGAKRIDGARELDQGTVAGQLDQAPAVFRQNRVEAFGTVLPQARQRAALVTPHQAGVADNVAATIAASLRCSRANGIPLDSYRKRRGTPRPGNSSNHLAAGRVGPAW